MKPSRIALSLAGLALLAACATEPTGPSAVVHVDGSTGMTVSGHVRFGDFSTGPGNVVATRSTPPAASCLSGCGSAVNVGIPSFRQDFDRRHAAAARKRVFTQEAPGGLEAVVRTIDQADSLSPQAASLWFGIPASVTAGGAVATRLAGSIEAPAGDRPAWRFVLLQDSAPQDPAKPAGWLVDDASRRILLRPLALAGGGFRFELDGRVIGSVELQPPGRVWMRDEMAPEVKLALASVASALLLTPRDD